MKPDTPSSFKSLILIGSMASWQGIPGAPLYSGSKHAVLGLMRSLATMASLLPKPLRLGCIHPFFVDTTILSISTKLALAGIPFTTTERVAGAIFYAATDPDEGSNHSSWLLADDGEVFLVPKEEFKFGVYAMIDARVNGLKA
jgi:NAD(P)-dependent dehydrogenase (short-subunit alcohol dehydrogenase family)